MVVMDEDIFWAIFDIRGARFGKEQQHMIWYMPSSTGSNKETQLIFSSDPASLERLIRKEIRSSSIDNNTSSSVDSRQPPSTQTPVSSTDTRSSPSTEDTPLPSIDTFHPISIDTSVRTSIDTEPRDMVATLILVLDERETCMTRKVICVMQQAVDTEGRAEVEEDVNFISGTGFQSYGNQSGNINSYGNMGSIDVGGVVSIDVERRKLVNDEGRLSVDGWVRESVDVKADASIDVERWSLRIERSKYMPSSTRTNKEAQLLFSSDPASLERSIRKVIRSSSIDNNTCSSLDFCQPPSTQTLVSSTDTRSPPSTEDTHLPSTDIFHPTSIDTSLRTSIDTEPSEDRRSGGSNP
ncbi:hypothetical protein F2Q70_00039047 [Brassica cretica]|uniref:Uncharacterized protein n=1 Tax=Brassica cretica TaxID=69181 RepID=A0A8S9K4L1_BRACR|nr:hypothetical protein F2Q70_00039047 [Brassica cretica]